MLLLLDNYDSFTYNLAQYFGELGCELLVKRNDEISIDEIAALAPRHICISPGPCTPREAGISKDVVLRFGGQIPILGVCLGHQCIAEAYGGKIIGTPHLMHGKSAITAAHFLSIFQRRLRPAATTHSSWSETPFRRASKLPPRATTGKSWR